MQLKKYCVYNYCKQGDIKASPIRSGLFQTVNDPGGGGALKAPPPYDLENYCVNLHHIIHANFTRCFRQHIHEPTPGLGSSTVLVLGTCT